MSHTKPISLFLILWSLSLVLSACAIATPTSQETPSFKTVILRDVQVLRGGRVVELRSDGALDVRLVAPGGKETRYAGQVSPEKVVELSNLLEEHHFATIVTQERAPVPDEARPEIEVVWQSGERTVVGKWANDVHPDFDAIYNWLVQLSDQMVEGGE